MKINTSTSMDKDFGVIVLAGTEIVFQKMLSNSIVMGNNLKSTVCLSGTGKLRAILGKMIVSDQPRNVLLNAFQQPLGCMSYVPTISVPHKLINNVILVMGR